MTLALGAFSTWGARVQLIQHILKCLINVYRPDIKLDMFLDPVNPIHMLGYVYIYIYVRVWVYVCMHACM